MQMPMSGHVRVRVRSACRATRYSEILLLVYLYGLDYLKYLRDQKPLQNNDFY